MAQALRERESPAQEFVGALSPATVNPMMLAKALRQRQAYERPDPMANYPQDWQQFGQNIAQSFPIDSREGVQRGAYNLAMGFGPQMIRAWHGSPHSIPMGRSMLTEKIGTGEGTQAYGHGLYAAEAPVVAKSYAPEDIIRFGGKESTNLPQPAALAGSMVRKHGGNIQAAISDLRSSSVKEYRNAGDWLERQSPNVSIEKGNLYQLELSHPNAATEARTPLSPDDFLHWDKPVSQQSQSVQDSINKTVNLTQREKQTLPIRSILELIGSPSEASAKLNQAGIPGTRYLDQGSRGLNGNVTQTSSGNWFISGSSTPYPTKALAEAASESAGQRTHNYVLFDPKLANIVGKE